jgi:RHS repeat-associated protein
VQITRGTSTRAAMTYDAGGNLLTDSRLGLQKTYTYNNRNRMATMSDGTTSYAYTYNGREQLAIRQRITAPAKTTHFVHDIFGNVIAETSGTAAGTKREYIWLPETEIAPTREAMSQVDRPLAVVDGVGTAGIVVWNVSVDHLNRPVLMTNSAKVTQWQAIWQPWGGAHSITGPAGTAANDYRLPGQWYQLESGLHYNWHRQYDPSIGRYTQADPLGFVDGPSVYGYAGGKPHQYVDPEGKFIAVPLITGGIGFLVSAGYQQYVYGCINWDDALYTGAMSAVGGSLGGAMFGLKQVGKEFSHFIPTRWGGPRSYWNGNYVSPYFHSATDWYRRLAGQKIGGDQLYPPVIRQILRTPATIAGALAGAGIGLTYRGLCGCRVRPD